MNAQNQVGALLAEAHERQKEGNLQEAARLCNILIGLQPQNGAALHLLGLIYLQGGNNEAALDCFSRAIEVEPENSSYFRGCGRACAALGLGAEAVQCYRRALELNPADAIADAIGVAVSFHQAGQLENAEKIYRQVLAAEPENADALHLSGLIARGSGDALSAVELIGRAAKAAPGVPFIHNNLGDALQSLGRIDEAIECYRRAIMLDGNFAEAHMNLGTAYLEKGMIEEAISSLRLALILAPQNAMAQNNLGRALAQAGRLEEGIEALERALALAPDYAEAHNTLGVLLGRQAAKNAASPQMQRAIFHLERAIELKPSYCDAHNNLGILCKESGDNEQAIEHFKRASLCNPAHAEACNNLGGTLHECERNEEALSYLERAVAIAPDFAAAHNNLGVVLNALNKPQAAIPHFERALAADPADASAHANIGSAYRLLGRFEEAYAHYRKALSLKPDYADGLNNLALLLQENGNAKEAVRLYENAVKLAPEKQIFHWNLALAYLAAGDLRRGWEKFDCRWQSAMKSYLRPFPQPWWDGSELSEKTILLWGEQGVGDEILYASLIPDAISRAAHCVIECEGRLVDLFARSFPEAEIVPRTLLPHPRTLASDIDWQIPVASLARHFRPSLDSFPEKRAYFAPEPSEAKKWRDRLSTLGAGPKVGICWRSRHNTSLRNINYTELGEWGPILSVAGAVFVNLQYDDCEAELDAARKKFGVEIHSFSDIDLMQDLDRVAALTSGLDLVISAGTAVAMMAGALAIPTWVMAVSAGWETFGTGRSPWHPSVRFFMRSWGQGWERVLQSVAGELSGFSRSFGKP